MSKRKSASSSDRASKKSRQTPEFVEDDEESQMQQQTVATEIIPDEDEEVEAKHHKSSAPQEEEEDAQEEEEEVEAQAQEEEEEEEEEEQDADMLSQEAKKALAVPAPAPAKVASPVPAAAVVKTPPKPLAQPVAPKAVAPAPKAVAPAPKAAATAAVISSTQAVALLDKKQKMPEKAVAPAAGAKKVVMGGRPGVPTKAQRTVAPPSDSQSQQPQLEFAPQDFLAGLGRTAASSKATSGNFGSFEGMVVIGEIVAFNKADERISLVALSFDEVKKGKFISGRVVPGGSVELVARFKDTRAFKGKEAEKAPCPPDSRYCPPDVTICLHPNCLVTVDTRKGKFDSGPNVQAMPDKYTGPVIAHIKLEPSFNIDKKGEEQRKKKKKKDATAEAAALAAGAAAAGMDLMQYVAQRKKLAITDGTDGEGEAPAVPEDPSNNNGDDDDPLIAHNIWSKLVRLEPLRNPDGTTLNLNDYEHHLYQLTVMREVARRNMERGIFVPYPSEFGVTGTLQFQQFLIPYGVNIPAKLKGAAAPKPDGTQLFRPGLLQTTVLYGKSFVYQALDEATQKMETIKRLYFNTDLMGIALTASAEDPKKLVKMSYKFHVYEPWTTEQEVPALGIYTAKTFSNWASLPHDGFVVASYVRKPELTKPQDLVANEATGELFSMPYHIHVSGYVPDLQKLAVDWGFLVTYDWLKAVGIKNERGKYKNQKLAEAIFTERQMEEATIVSRKTPFLFNDHSIAKLVNCDAGAGFEFRLIPPVYHITRIYREKNDAVEKEAAALPTAEEAEAHIAQHQVAIPTTLKEFLETIHEVDTTFIDDDGNKKSFVNKDNTPNWNNWIDYAESMRIDGLVDENKLLFVGVAIPRPSKITSLSSHPFFSRPEREFVPVDYTDIVGIIPPAEKYVDPLLKAVYPHAVPGDRGYDDEVKALMDARNKALEEAEAESQVE